MAAAARCNDHASHRVTPVIATAVANTRAPRPLVAGPRRTPWSLGGRATLLTHVPGIPATPCVAEFHVKLSGCEGFATLERGESFITGKSFTITPGMAALPAPGQDALAPLARWHRLCHTPAVGRALAVGRASVRAREACLWREVATALAGSRASSLSAIAQRAGSRDGWTVALPIGGAAHRQPRTRRPSRSPQCAVSGN